MCHTVTTIYSCGCEEKSAVIQCRATAGTNRTCATIQEDSYSALSHACAACVAKAEAAAREAREAAERAAHEAGG